MKKLKVAVLSGGPSAEHEVSINSAKNVIKNINTETYDVIPVVISKDCIWNIDNKCFSEEEALVYIKEHIDLVFIVLHGEYGEDGTLQKKLELAGIKFTGSGSEASALAMDKAKSSLILEEAGLKIPQFVNLMIKNKELDDLFLDNVKKLGLPLVVKPTDGGSSVGTTVIYKEEELKNAINEAAKYSENIMIQEYIKGRELTCGVIENNDDLEALIPTEIIPNNEDLFFDYKAKYEKGASIELTPPNLSEETIKEIQDLSVMSHRFLGCKGLSRSDFILRDDALFFLEVNTIPGMTETSLLPQGAKASGIEFTELIDHIIKSDLKS